MRSFQIIKNFIYYLVFYKFSQYKEKSFGVRLRIALSELGFTFIKIGQILSMRYDVLNKESCEELQQLLDNVNPISYEIIENVLHKELKKSPDKIFKKIYKKPLASASVSQVHKAVLKNGKTVAVKIKRPNIEKTLRKDLRIFHALAYLGYVFSSTLRRVQILDLAQYFEKWIWQDIDFKKEVENMQIIKKRYTFVDEKQHREDLGRGFFPEPEEAFCTNNIIVMDFIDGVTLNKIGKVRKNPKYNLEKSIKTYMNAAAYLWMEGEEYSFQADPHLSNIMVLPNGNSANVDLGLTVHMSKKHTQLTRDLFLAIYSKNLEDVVEYSLQLTNITYIKNEKIFKDDIKKYLKEVHKREIGFWFIDIVKIFMKHKMPYPEEIIDLGRCILLLDGAVQIVLPGKTTLDLIGNELQRALLEKIKNNLEEVEIMPLAYNLSKKVKESPQIIEDVLEKFLHVVRSKKAV